MKHFKTREGVEIGLPAEFEKRWGTHGVTLEDHGDHLVIRPMLETSEYPEEHFADVDTPEAARRGGAGGGY